LAAAAASFSAAGTGVGADMVARRYSCRSPGQAVQMSDHGGLPSTKDGFDQISAGFDRRRYLLCSQRSGNRGPFLSGVQQQKADDAIPLLSCLRQLSRSIAHAKPNATCDGKPRYVPCVDSYWCCRQHAGRSLEKGWCESAGKSYTPHLR
jgi:hypothetical protein